MSSPRRKHVTPRLGLLALALAAIAISGCSVSDRESNGTVITQNNNKDFARGTGTPALATKNTVRIPGVGPVANAAAAALAVYPSHAPSTQPQAVSLVESSDWRAMLTMSVLMAKPLRAPILLGENDELPDITKSALEAMRPRGARDLPLKPQVIAAPGVKLPDFVRRRQIQASDIYELGATVDRMQAQLAKGFSPEVIVLSADPAAALYNMSVGALAAKTGTPILWVAKSVVPRETIRALKRRGRPRIYIFGSSRIISRKVAGRLRRFGRVQRIAGKTPVQNSIAVALYIDSEQGWGWGIDDPGHGLVIASTSKMMDAAAGTSLATSGAYGPLLLNDSPTKLNPALEGFLLDIQPGYIEDPARGFYNRAWILGNEAVVSPAVQARIDELAEIQPIKLDATDGSND